MTAAIAGAAIVAVAYGSAYAQSRLNERVQVQPEAMIGVFTRDAPPDQPEGAVITSVQSGTPAASAGFKDGDVIVEFDGERVRSSAHLARLVRETPPGRAIKTVVMREGKRVVLTVTPTASRVRSFTFELPTPEFREGPLQRPFTPWLDQGPASPGGNWAYRFQPGPRRPLLPGVARLGISVQDLTPQLATYFGTTEGVLVATVDDRSAAAAAGLKAGDIITAIDGRQMTSTRDVQQALVGKRAGDRIRMDIVRDRKARAVTVTLEDERRGF